MQERFEYTKGVIRSKPWIEGQTTQLIQWPKGQTTQLIQWTTKHY